MRINFLSLYKYLGNILLTCKAQDIYCLVLYRRSSPTSVLAVAAGLIVLIILNARQTVSECHILGYLLLYFASCVNPIIYVIMNKQYRQAYAGVIGCSWIRASLTPYGSSAPGGAGGLQAHQHDYAQGNFKQRHAVTLTKL